MPVRLKDGLIVITAGEDEAGPDAVAWREVHNDHAFLLSVQDARTIVLRDLGPRAEACHEPINVVSASAGEAVRLISNLAHTPFELLGRSYASVEAFWQALKFPDDGDRHRIASLHGLEAKRAGATATDADAFQYRGTSYRTGSPEHWSLMRAACWAKFSQHAAARAALLGTGNRPLIHRVRRDSRTIPGVVMADIWMRVRSRLAKSAC